jgi:hypothetical protein
MGVAARWDFGFVPVSVYGWFTYPPIVTQLGMEWKKGGDFPTTKMIPSKELNKSHMR